MALELPYILAKPVKTSSKLKEVTVEGETTGPESWVLIEGVENPEEELAFLWEGSAESGEPYLVTDLETKGTEAHNEDDCYPVLVGFYSPVRGGVAIDLRSSHSSSFAIISQKLAEWQVPLVAYNNTFDSAFYRRYWKGTPEHNWLTDVYVLHKLICGEGFEGQRWGLAFANEQLLGWDAGKDEVIQQWLVEQGHTKGTISKEIMQKLVGD